MARGYQYAKRMKILMPNGKIKAAQRALDAARTMSLSDPAQRLGNARDRERAVAAGLAKGRKRGRPRKIRKS
jgi:hypothetical protein